ncbi:tRNA lysidine(34) synthetase TilS [Paraoerskovia marina]|uniref:tRNA lysidine(34) synthetase TilS n=1 Tax=Paraoerskovia marina TaxID=545619 RepID=UPI00049289A2|nr:tRNA lysidine(34) synthetase TilS [Paraoerskovia marina]
MVGPHPAEAALRRAVRDSLADLDDDALVLVACSGGADSLALAAGLAFVAPRRGLRAGAVVVDHALQAGSDDVAGRAARQCQDLGLDPVVVERVRVGTAGGPEAAARTARYDALERAARDLGAQAVLLGHTRDDQAETVLLGLGRGSGARSLAGMAPRRGPWRRPILGLRRRDTEAVCAARGLDPWTDPTNLLPAGPRAGVPRRTQVRHVVVPVLEDVLGPGAVDALARSADLLRDDADLLDTLADALGSRAERPTDLPGGVALDTAALAEAPRPLRRRVLRAAARRAGCPAGSLSLRHVEAMDDLVVDWHGQKPLDLPGGVAVARRCGTLVLGPPRA